MHTWIPEQRPVSLKRAAPDEVLELRKTIRELEERLRRTEQHHRQLFDNLPAAVYTCDAEGRITFANRRAVELWGREPALGEPDERFCGAFRLWRPDGSPLPHAESPMAAAIHEGTESRNGEVTIERPDGSRVVVSVNIDPLYDETGRRSGAINVFQDVTALKQAEGKLNRRTMELSAFVETAALGLHWVGEDGRILWANAAELELLGYSADEYIGRSITEFHDDQEAIDDILARLRHGENVRDREARMRCKDGSIKHVLVDSNVLWDHGRFVHTQCFTRDISDRKRAEELLRDSEQRFRSLVNSVEGIVWECRIEPDDFPFTFVSRQAERLLGYPLQQWLTERDFWPKHIHPDDRAWAVNYCKAATREKQDHEFEYRMIAADGRIVWLRDIVTVVVENDRPVRLVGVMVDITGIKATEERLGLELEDTKRLHVLSARLLKESSLESHLREVLLASMDLTGTDKGNIQLYDGTECALKIAAHVGFSAEFLDDFRSVPRGHSVCGLAFERCERVIMENAFTDPRFSDLAPVYAKYGFVAVQSTPLIGTDGRFLGMLSTHFARPHRPSDRELQLLDLFAQQAVRVIERKRAEENRRRLFELVASVNRATALSDIFDAALEAICQCHSAPRASILLYDSDGVMRFKAWRELSDGYRQAVEGHSPWGRTQLDPQPICLEDVSTVELEPSLREVVEREGIRSLAFIPITNDRRLLGKFMIYYNTPHGFSREEIGLARTIASQIAFAIERHKSGEALERLVDERTAQLRQTIHELQTLSYSIAHDMRAPLRAMGAFAHILLEEYAGAASPSQAQDYCRRIVTGAGRLDRLIQDALNYTKTVLQELPLEPVDLCRLLNGLIDTYPNLHPENAEIIIEGDLPEVLGNESLLTQCFSNLLGNAVKFVAPRTRPQVRVRAETTNGMGRIWIQDNGIGISAHAQQRLFQIFQKLDNQYEGTGMGLAIVRKVVEHMGGRVGVESEAGSGSRFWVDLPLAVSQDTDLPAAP